MKIIDHNECSYTYDEFEIDEYPDEIRHFRRNKIESKFQWEYFDKFEQAWFSVDYDEQISNLENIYQDWSYIQMLNQGLPEHLKVKL